MKVEEAMRILRYELQQKPDLVVVFHVIQDGLAQQERDIAALVEGMAVSIDVSTGDHDSTHRLFGVVDLVQENQGSKHGLILLVQEPKANFKETLAQPEQEPVAYLCKPDENGLYGLPTPDRGCQDCFPVYRHLQRTWVGLTDDQIAKAIGSINMLHGDYATEIAYAIEAKLKELNP